MACFGGVTFASAVLAAERVGTFEIGVSSILAHRAHQSGPSRRVLASHSRVADGVAALTVIVLGSGQRAVIVPDISVAIILRLGVFILLRLMVILSKLAVLPDLAILVVWMMHVRGDCAFPVGVVSALVHIAQIVETRR